MLAPKSYSDCCSFLVLRLSIPIGVCFAVLFLHEPISDRAIIANIALLGGLPLVVVYS